MDHKSHKFSFVGQEARGYYRLHAYKAHASQLLTYYKALRLIFVHSLYNSMALNTLLSTKISPTSFFYIQGQPVLSICIFVLKVLHINHSILQMFTQGYMSVWSEMLIAFFFFFFFS